MKTISIYNGNGYFDVEVSDEFAEKYKEIESEEIRINRRETRRHQSLEASVDNGFDIADEEVNVEESVVQQDEYERLHIGLKMLTELQLYVLMAHAIDEKSFSVIATELGIHKSTVKGHYISAIKKMQKFLS